MKKVNQLFVFCVMMSVVWTIAICTVRAAERDMSLSPDSPIPATWWQRATCLPSSGNTRIEGTNPNGNGAISFTDAEPEWITWIVPNRYIWIVYYNDGYVRYYNIDLRGYVGADSIYVRQHVHGTSSGGRSQTLWFVSVNDLWRWDSPDTLWAGGWQWWRYSDRNPSQYWHWNSSNNFFKIGLQSNSGTVIGIDTIWVQMFNARPVGVEEQGGQGRIITSAPLLKVAPNPLLGSTTISFNCNLKNRAKVSIYDASGSLVRELEIPTNQPVTWDAKRCDGRKLPAGVYFLRATAGNFTATEKLVIAR